MGPYQHVATLSKLCSPVGVGTTSFILHITHNYCVLICLHPTYHTYPEGKWHDFRISTWQTNSFGSNLFLQVSHAALLCIFWGKAAKQLIVFKHILTWQAPPDRYLKSLATVEDHVQRCSLVRCNWAKSIGIFEMGQPHWPNAEQSRMALSRTNQTNTPSSSDSDR